jgi:hypothetical protein
VTDETVGSGTQRPWPVAAHGVADGQPAVISQAPQQCCDGKTWMLYAPPGTPPPPPLEHSVRGPSSHRHCHSALHYRTPSSRTVQRTACRSRGHAREARGKNLEERKDALREKSDDEIERLVKNASLGGETLRVCSVTEPRAWRNSPAEEPSRHYNPAASRLRLDNQRSMGRTPSSGRDALSHDKFHGLQNSWPRSFQTPSSTHRVSGVRRGDRGAANHRRLE